MLNATRVLTYIKDNLGFPFMKLELDDDKLLHHATEYSLREFSYYVPERRKMSLDLSDDRIKVPGRANEFYIQDDQGLEILNIIDIYFNASELYLHGHRPFGPLNHGELRGWALDVETSMETKMFSTFDYTFEFNHPNVVRVSPYPISVAQNVTVEYERMQPPDFSGIPNEFQLLFCEFALADIMIIVGRIRRKYGGGNLRTPFGDIPLEGEILDEGRDKKREVIEKLNLGPLMNVIIDHG